MDPRRGENMVEHRKGHKDQERRGTQRPSQPSAPCQHPPGPFQSKPDSDLALCKEADSWSSWTAPGESCGQPGSPGLVQARFYLATHIPLSMLILNHGRPKFSYQTSSHGSYPHDITNYKTEEKLRGNSLVEL